MQAMDISAMISKGHFSKDKTVEPFRKEQMS